jgi:hypothetical protein
MISRSAIVAGDKMRTLRGVLIWFIASISVASLCQAAEPADSRAHSFLFEPGELEEQLPREFRLAAKSVTATERVVDSSLSLVTFPFAVARDVPLAGRKRASAERRRAC